MNFAIDIGNTLIKAGSFHEGRLVAVNTADNYEALSRLIANELPENVILSSVRGDASEIIKNNPIGGRYFIFDNSTPLPIINLYNTPETLGTDRIAACIGASSLYRGTDCLVVDVGTCIKCDFIDREGRFLGGSISPGLKMRFEALNQFTARLPLVTQRSVDFIIGQSTEKSILNGVMNGALFEIEGFIENYSKIFPQLNVILTGGDALSFETKIKQHIFVVPNLVLLGLNEILQYNLSYTSA